jgi:hypothetical protein
LRRLLRVEVGLFAERGDGIHQKLGVVSADEPRGNDAASLGWLQRG